MSTSLDLLTWAVQVGAEVYLGKPFDVASPGMDNEPEGFGGIYLFERLTKPI